MNIIFLIKNLNTNEYFGSYRIDDYWTNDIEDAVHYKDESEALAVIENDEQYSDFFDDVYLSIEKIYKK